MRKKGQIARSQDFPSAFTFVTSISIVLVSAHLIYGQLATFFLQCFRRVGSKDLIPQVLGLIEDGIFTMLYASWPIAMLTTFVGVLITFLIQGPVFTTEVFKLNFKKFNPVDNLKAKFKLKTLIELIKSILKLSIAGIIIYTVVNSGLERLAATATLPPLGAALVFNSFLTELVFKIGLVFLGIAAFDLFYQKYNFANEMKMEKFEVKQEYKDTEGNPEIKGHRRQVAREIAYEDRPSIKKAKAVITNPDHVAVAIGYDPEQYAAPWIVAKGKDNVAMWIINEAEKYNIPIMRDVPLAHQLFDEGQVLHYIPSSTYEAMAEVLRFIMGLQQRE